MSKVLVLPLLVALLVLIQAPTPRVSTPTSWSPPVGIEWQIEDIHDAGYSVSLALDSDGNPHISYSKRDPEDQNSLYSLWYASRIGGHWNHERVADMWGGGITNLALKYNKQAIIAYTACTPFYCQLFTAQKAASTWIIQNLVDSVGGGSLSMDLDSNDRPHLAYCSQNLSTLELELWHMYWSGSQWITDLVDAGCWYSISLRLDSENHARISYYNDKGDLNYAQWTGREWSFDTIDTALGTGSWNDMALDSADRPHVVYLDKTTWTLMYAMWNGLAWEIQVVDQSLLFEDPISIAIDSSDRPHIAYTWYTYNDNQLESKLRYAFWTGQNWSIWDVNQGDSPSLALDANDQPHIVYRLLGDLKYAQGERIPLDKSFFLPFVQLK